MVVWLYEPITFERGADMSASTLCIDLEAVVNKEK